MVDVVMLLLVSCGVAALSLGLAARAGRRTPRDHAPPAPPSPRPPGMVAVDGRLRVALDVRVPDPELPAAQRLVDRVASGHLERPGVRVVDVLDLDGRVVGQRQQHRPSRPVIQRLDQPAAETTAPAPAASKADATAASIALGPASTGSTTALRNRLDLPPGVGDDVDDDPSVGELVAALLDASGTAATTRAGVIAVEGIAIVPIDAMDPTGRVTGPELDQAYLRFKASGAHRGIVITDGQLPLRELDRRQLLAPELRHGGTEALQRLADEVALGGDVTAALVELTGASEPTGAVAG